MEKTIISVSIQTDGNKLEISATILEETYKEVWEVTNTGSRLIEGKTFDSIAGLSGDVKEALDSISSACQGILWYAEQVQEEE